MLTPVDHLIGSHLGLGTFVRYCDDILVFDNDLGRLRAAWQAIEARCDALRLRLHPSKCRLHHTTESVAFLGFVAPPTGRRRHREAAHENLRRFRARVRFMQQLYACGAIGPDDVDDRSRACSPMPATATPARFAAACSGISRSPARRWTIHKDPPGPAGIRLGLGRGQQRLGRRHCSRPRLAARRNAGGLWIVTPAGP